MKKNMTVIAKIVKGFQPLIFFRKKTPSQMFKWVINTSLNKNKFFYKIIFGIDLFRCKANRTNDGKEARQHVTTYDI